MAIVPTFNNKDRLRKVREESLNPAINKVNTLEQNQGLLLNEIVSLKAATTELEHKVQDNSDNLGKVAEEVGKSFSGCSVEADTKLINYFHKTTGQYLGSCDLSPMFTDVESGVDVEGFDFPRRHFTALRMIGNGVGVSVDPADPDKAVITVTGGGGGGVGKINAVLGSGKSREIDTIHVIGDTHNSDIDGTALNLYLPNKRFEGFANSWDDLRKFATNSEIGQSWAFLKKESTPVDGTDPEIGQIPMIYNNVGSPATPTWIPFHSLGSLTLKSKNKGTASGYSVSGFAESLVLTDNIEVVAGNIKIKDSTVLSEINRLNGSAKESFELAGIEIQGDESFVTSESIPGQTSKKIVLKQQSKPTAQIGSDVEKAISKIRVTGHTGDSSISDSTLNINLPQPTATVKKGVESLDGNVDKTVVFGNVGLSTVANKELQIDIPYLKVGKKTEAIFEPSHRSYAYNEPFEQWDDGHVWNPIKAGLEKKWHSDESWEDGSPWAVYATSKRSDTGVLEFSGNVDIAYDSDSKMTTIDVPYMTAQVGSDAKQNITGIRVPNLGGDIEDGTLCMRYFPIPGQTMIQIGNKTPRLVDVLKLDEDDAEDYEEVEEEGHLKNGRKGVKVTGFERFPKKFKHTGTSNFDIDKPTKATRFIYLDPSDKDGVNYTYVEPFATWKDKYRWNALKEGSPSQSLVKKGGWVMNLYTGPGEDKSERDSIKQVFYPADDSAPMHRSAPYDEIGSKPWVTFSSLLTSVSGGEEGSPIDFLKFESEFASIKDGTVSIPTQVFKDDSGKSSEFKEVKAGKNITMSVGSGDSAGVLTINSTDTQFEFEAKVKDGEYQPISKIDASSTYAEIVDNALKLPVVSAMDSNASLVGSIKNIKEGSNITFEKSTAEGEDGVIIISAKETDSGIKIGKVTDAGEEVIPTVKTIFVNESDLTISEGSDKATITGFDRFPSKFKSSDVFNIDAPVEGSEFVYIKKGTKPSSYVSYSFKEPFANWKDKKRWSYLDKGSKSGPLLEKGGWVMNLFAIEGESKFVQQTFYPQDNSAPMYRSSELGSISDQDWKSLGSMTGRAGTTSDDQVITGIIVEDPNMATFDGTKLKIKKPKSSIKAKVNGKELSISTIEVSNPFAEVSSGVLKLPVVSAEDSNGSTLGAIKNIKAGKAVQLDMSTDEKDKGVLTMNVELPDPITASKPAVHLPEEEEFDESGTPVKKLIIPEKVGSISEEGVVTFVEQEPNDKILIRDIHSTGTTRQVDAIGLDTDDYSVTIADGKTSADITGLKRFPKKFSDSPEFNIDQPTEETSFAYVKAGTVPKTYIAYTFKEPFEKWKDNKRWSYMDEGSKSADLLKKGGWIMNLFASEGDNKFVQQTFYPQDGTVPMYRSANISLIGQKDWTPAGGSSGMSVKVPSGDTVYVDNPFKPLSKIEIMGDKELFSYDEDEGLLNLSVRGYTPEVEKNVDITSEYPPSENNGRFVIKKLNDVEPILREMYYCDGSGWNLVDGAGNVLSCMGLFDTKQAFFNEVISLLSKGKILSKNISIAYIPHYNPQSTGDRKKLIHKTCFTWNSTKSNPTATEVKDESNWKIDIVSGAEYATRILGKDSTFAPDWTPESTDSYPPAEYPGQTIYYQDKAEISTATGWYKSNGLMWTKDLAATVGIARSFLGVHDSEVALKTAVAQYVLQGYSIPKGSIGFVRKDSSIKPGVSVYYTVWEWISEIGRPSFTQANEAANWKHVDAFPNKDETIRLRGKGTDLPDWTPTNPVGSTASDHKGQIVYYIPKDGSATKEGWYFSNGTSWNTASGGGGIKGKINQDAATSIKQISLTSKIASKIVNSEFFSAKIEDRNLTLDVFPPVVSDVTAGQSISVEYPEASTPTGLIAYQPFTEGSPTAFVRMAGKRKDDQDKTVQDWGLIGYHSDLGLNKGWSGDHLMSLNRRFSEQTTDVYPLTQDSWKSNGLYHASSKSIADNIGTSVVQNFVSGEFDDKKRYGQMIYDLEKGSVFYRHYNAASGNVSGVQQLFGLSDKHYSIYTMFSGAKYGDIKDKDYMPIHVVQDPQANTLSHDDGTVQVMAYGGYKVSNVITLSGKNIGGTHKYTYLYRLYNKVTGTDYSKVEGEVVAVQSTTDQSQYYIPALNFETDVVLTDTASIGFHFGISTTESQATKVEDLFMDPYKNYFVIEPAESKTKTGVKIAKTLRSTFGGFATMSDIEVRGRQRRGGGSTVTSHFDSNPNPITFYTKGDE